MFLSIWIIPYLLGTRVKSYRFISLIGVKKKKWFIHARTYLKISNVCLGQKPILTFLNRFLELWIILKVVKVTTLSMAKNKHL
jgi:hypothetical protein